METTPLKIATYTALLNQSGTNNPIPTVLQNTIINTPTIAWARTSTGIYTATLTGAFTPNKTAAQLQCGSSPRLITTEYTSQNVITITHKTDASVFVDGLTNVRIEINIYQ